MDTQASFGYLVRRQRKALDLTQQALADEVGCSLAAIKKIEGDERRPSRQIAERLADVFAIPNADREAFIEAARGLRRVGEIASPHEAAASLPTGTGIRKDFSHSDSPSVFPNNLPAQLTSFVGRERELADLQRLLSTTRLLTLTGPGGTGKSRLALQLAAGVLESFGHGVWLVELAPLSEPSLVAQIVAGALGVRERPGRTTMEVLADYLRAKAMLIVLDNCEHLIDACARLAEALLRAAPDLKILVTSREVLGILGEAVYQVPTLENPPSLQVSGIRAEELAEYAAAQLFTERAKQFLPSFRLTDANASPVAQICYRLDGMPLAIELAAARVRALPVEEIAARLSDRFRLLTEGGRTSLPRHQTLRSLIDWSHGLLTEGEQILLRRLSVFAGGWTLSAAERVCSGTGLESEHILDLLTHLGNKSLISLDHAGAASRYRMLETIREYAREKLSASGEAAGLRDKHLGYMVELVKDAETRFHGFDESVAFDRLEQEAGNVRSALEWGLSLDNPDPVLALSGRLGWFWWVRGYVLEAIAWMTRALERPAAEKVTPERAKALTELAWLQGALGDYVSCRARFEESDAISRKLGDKRALAETLSTWCQWIALYGSTAARPVLEEALAISHELDYKPGEARSLIGQGELQVYEGDDVAAEQSFEQCAVLVRTLGDRNFLSYVVRRLGHVALRKPDFPSANTLCAESLRLNREQKDPHGIAACLTAFGSIAARQHDASRGAQLYGAAAAVLESYGGKLVPLDEFENRAYMLSVHEALGEEEYERAYSEGRSMSTEDAIVMALESTRQ